jgi:trans-AT polyketide synthase, acyltransferase and oxidoreductase domains
MRPVVFMFSGQGSHHLQMGAELFRHDAVFRDTMLHLDRLAAPVVGRSVTELLYSEGRAGTPFSRTLESHPAIFMVEYALVRSLEAQGLRPDVLLGVSLGELAAAAVSGMLEPDEALAAVLVQAQALEQACEPGAMLAVLGDPALTEGAAPLPAGVELAGRNDHFQFVVSGRAPALEAYAARLREASIASQRLPVSQAFHSSLIDPAQAACVADLRRRSFRRAALPVVSGRDGDERRERDAEHFWSVVRGPMRFAEAVRRLLRSGDPLFVDVGPAGTLSNLIRFGLTRDGRPETCSVLSPHGGDLDRARALTRRHGRPAHSVQEGSRPMLTYVFPGQGSQRKGMGAALFSRFPQQTQQASRILGYSLEKLCLEDEGGKLSDTRYTQPALFVVSALSYLEQREKDGEPQLLAGHSLGEYAALFAAGSFDFETGLRLVQRRGELMGEAKGGAMAAVLGLSRGRVEELLALPELEALDLANINTPTQMVIAGPPQVLASARAVFEKAGARGFVPLRVSAAFHSRYMIAAASAFAEFAAGFELRAPRIPVLSNVEAMPYPADRVRELLAAQIARPVDWLGCMRQVRAQPSVRIVEVGPGMTLTGMLRDFDAEPPAAPPAAPARPSVAPSPLPKPPPEPARAEPEPSPRPLAATCADVARTVADISPGALGSAEYRADYGVAYAYAAGSMYRGIASKELVVAMGKAGLIGYLGTGGLALGEIESAIVHIQRELCSGEAYGVNLLSSPQNPKLEEDSVDLYLRHGVQNLEAASFMVLSPALVRYRIMGLTRDGNGGVLARNRIMAKVSRPEVAEAFLRPAPERITKHLLERRHITREQAALAERMPVADDLCVEADSGGHTDQGVAYAITPAIALLRDRISAEYGYTKRIRVGAAGGIGAPAAAAAAFMLGADFILTGSINQCTVEAGTSDAAKDLLEGLDVQDFEYAPAGDLFEFGARVQVVKKGLFFPARANKLYDLYRFHESLDAIDVKTREQLEATYFRKSLAAVYEDVKAYYPAADIAKAEAVPKYKMALIFKWYFGHSTRLALSGAKENKLDYQVHSGPALGAFNQWVKGTRLERWKQRSGGEIGRFLMGETARVLTERYRSFIAPPARGAMGSA